MADILTPLRIGVTGSRSWSDARVIGQALRSACERGRPHEGHVLVHGQCDPWHPATKQRIPWHRAVRLTPETQGRLLGADWLTDLVVRDLGPAGSGWAAEPHPANWWPNGTYDRTAGFKRNAAMVKLGADEWESFSALCADRRCTQPEAHGSHGTDHCTREVERAGIPLHRFYAGIEREAGA